MPANPTESHAAKHRAWWWPCLASISAVFAFIFMVTGLQLPIPASTDVVVPGLHIAWAIFDTPPNFDFTYLALQGLLYGIALSYANRLGRLTTGFCAVSAFHFTCFLTCSSIAASIRNWI